jgi:hypothetical protein
MQHSHCIPTYNTLTAPQQTGPSGFVAAGFANFLNVSGTTQPPAARQAPLTQPPSSAPSNGQSQGGKQGMSGYWTYNSTGGMRFDNVNWPPVPGHLSLYLCNSSFIDSTSSASVQSGCLLVPVIPDVKLPQGNTGQLFYTGSYNFAYRYGKGTKVEFSSQLVCQWHVCVHDGAHEYDHYTRSCRLRGSQQECRGGSEDCTAHYTAHGVCKRFCEGLCVSFSLVTALLHPQPRSSLAPRARLSTRDRSNWILLLFLVSGDSHASVPGLHGVTGAPYKGAQFMLYLALFLLSVVFVSLMLTWEKRTSQT